MNRRTIVCVIVALSLVGTTAKAVEVDVTIKSVDVKSRTITVVYETEQGSKSIDLDVGRKAEITLNDKSTTLELLGGGLKAHVSYNKELMVVTKIVATGTPIIAKKPELVELSELNDEGLNNVCCLSEDGLTIYWARGVGKNKKLWTAHRDSPRSVFTDKKELFKGGSMTLSSDGLEMILYSDRSDGQNDFSLYVATREATDKPWERPKEISELSDYFSSGPCLSPDGNTLFFSVRPSPAAWGRVSIVHSTRKDKSSPWSKPKPVPNVTVRSGYLRFPSMATDGLHLLCGHARPNENGEQTSIMIWSRPAVDKPFQKGNYLETGNLPPLVCSLGCTYAVATNELFFSRDMFRNGKQLPNTGIWVVKSFVLPDVANGPEQSE